MSAESEQQATAVFSALGQPTRLAILKCLAAHSRGEDAPGMAAGEIARTLDLAPATLSFHLKDMTYKGLLVPERKGRSIFYRVNIDLLLSSLDFVVTEICEG